MPCRPPFKFFLSSINHPVDKDSVIWNSPLRITRNPSQSPQPKVNHPPVTHGDYFCAARNFLSENRFKMVSLALSQHLGRTAKPEEIQKIFIRLEKHGQFYHPARVEILVDGSELKFVLNVAVSDSGKACIKREFHLLEKLNTDFPHPYLPKVYGQGAAFIKAAGVELLMFLGEWFEGYNEFHISQDQKDQTDKIIVWDPDQGHFFLSAPEALELYRQAAMILTGYYNLETFEQIYPWHHAAGDFIVKLEKDKLRLKLITVRQYGAMFGMRTQDQDKNDEPDSIWEALLIFLLNLSIRMRLDRLDGVGAIVWSNSIAVEGTVKGFFQALALKSAVRSVSDTAVAGFKRYMASITVAELNDLAQALVNSYHPMAPDVPVIKKILKEHVEALLHFLNIDA